MDATNKEGSPKQLRGRSLGTKLSESSIRSVSEVILAEVLALRKIVINRCTATRREDR